MGKEVLLGRLPAGSQVVSSTLSSFGLIEIIDRPGPGRGFKIT